MDNSILRGQEKSYLVRIYSLDLFHSKETLVHRPAQNGTPEKRIFSAIALNGSSRLIRIITQIGMITAMGMLLPTQDLAASLFFLLIIEIGTTLTTKTFTQSLMNKCDKFDQYESSAFYLNFSLSIIASIVTFLLSYFYLNNSTEIDHIFGSLFSVMAISIGPIISSMTIIPQARFSASVNFGPIALSESISVFTSSIFAIIFAFFFRSYEAIIVYLIFQRIFEFCILSFFCYPLPRSLPDRVTAVEHLRFSAPLIATFLITSAVVTADQFFVGLFFGADVFALYAFARRLTDQPVRILMHALERSMIPTLVSIKSNIDQYKKFCLHAFFLCSLISGSFFLPFIAGSKPFVDFLFPENLHDSYKFISIFSAQSAFIPIGSLLFSILVSFGRTKWIFFFTFTRLFVAFSIILILALSLSLNSVQFAITVAFMNVAMLIPNFALANRDLNIPTTKVLKAILRGHVPGLIGLSVCLATPLFVHGSSYFLFLVQIVLTISSVIISTLLIAKDEISSIKISRWRKK